MILIDGNLNGKILGVEIVIGIVVQTNQHTIKTPQNDFIML
jgi:uncharacterized protein YuzE